MRISTGPPSRLLRRLEARPGPEPPLEGDDPLESRLELAEQGRAPQELAVRQRRHPGDDRAGRDAAPPRDASLAGQDRAVADRDVVGDPDLARERDARPDARRAADSRLPAE